jgi:hypothetical protein
VDPRGRSGTLVGAREAGLPMILFALLGAPVAWSLRLLGAYFLVALFCAQGWRGGAAAILATTAVLAGVSAASGVVAFRKWQALRGGEDWLSGLTQPQGRVSFLLVVGAMNAVLFTLLILLEGLPVLFVPVCEATLP